MKEQNGQSPANKRVGFIIAACVLVLVLGAMGVFLMNFILLDGTVYSRNTAVLNLSGSDIEDFSALGKLHKLEKVDLTHTSLRDLSVWLLSFFTGSGYLSAHIGRLSEPHRSLLLHPGLL